MNIMVIVLIMKSKNRHCSASRPTVDLRHLNGTSPRAQGPARGTGNQAIGGPGGPPPPAHALLTSQQARDINAEQEGPRASASFKADCSIRAVTFRFKD